MTFKENEREGMFMQSIKEVSILTKYLPIPNFV